MKKFSVIITHYNQMKYIEEAIKSVFKQDYLNMEIIIADDCSKTFDKKKVQKLIEKYNKKNLPYKIVAGKVNEGTVKNINRAVKSTTGDYIMFFAADDELSNDKVISNFAKEFEDENKKIVTAQCVQCGSTFDKKFGRFVKVFKSLRLNKKSSLKIYETMAEGCCYASGATAYKREVFEKYGYYDEEYKYVEDWSYWLKVLREGEKMYYSNFDALNHRDGGISHSEFTKLTLPPHVKQYYIDIINIYKKEVFPYIDRFNNLEKYKILVQFHETTVYYANYVPELFKELSIIDEIRSKNKSFNLLWKFMTIFTNFKRFIILKSKILLKYNIIVPITFFIWCISTYLLNMLNVDNNILLMLYTIMYFIIYIFVNFVYNSIKIFKNKELGGR